MAEDKKGKDEGTEDEAPAEAAPKAGKKKLLLIIGGVTFLLFAIGAPTAYFLLKSGEKPEVDSADPNSAEHGPQPVAEGADEEEDELDENEESIGAIFPLETFVVNLAGGRYVRLQVQLEFVEREIPKRFYTKLVPLRDALIATLSKRTQEELGTDKGRENLREDIKDLTNELMRREDVKRVYFTQFVVQ